jgi:hypothetical protein
VAHAPRRSSGVQGFDCIGRRKQLESLLIKINYDKASVFTARRGAECGRFLSVLCEVLSLSLRYVNGLAFSVRAQRAGRSPLRFASARHHGRGTCPRPAARPPHLAPRPGSDLSTGRGGSRTRGAQALLSGDRPLLPSPSTYAATAATATGQGTQSPVRPRPGRPRPGRPRLGQP